MSLIAEATDILGRHVGELGSITQDLSATTNTRQRGCQPATEVPEEGTNPDMRRVT